MEFKLTPILDQMAALYRLPRSRRRFEDYLQMLQGESKADLVLPIAGYNPMAKENALLKLEALQALRAESIIEIELADINKQLQDKDQRVIEVVINLADDVGGAWSNLYTTDYTSKFAIGPLVKRNFCTPYFWTSENYTEASIIQRAREYVFRTVYVIKNGSPKCLEDFFNQEVYVQLNATTKRQGVEVEDFAKVEEFYLAHLSSEDYNLIFNFFYGDEASQELAYTRYGMDEQAGFAYAKYMAKK